MSFVFPRSSLGKVPVAAALIVLLTIVTLVGLSIVNAATLGPIQNVSRDGAPSILPHVAQDNSGNVHVVWDSGGSSRQVRYSKGTWNGSSYNFSNSVILADVGGYQYSTPNIIAARNGTVMASWSASNGVYIRAWNAADAQPGGTAQFLGGGLQSTLAVDNNSHFHISWNGDFKVQYREWFNGQILKTDGFSDNESNRPDITVDSNNNVHLVWDKGSGVKYRARQAGGDWRNIENLDTGGNFAQITADGQGNVYIVWSNNFDIQFCQRTFGQPCGGRRVFDSAADLAPTIGATRTGKILVSYRDGDFRGLWYAVRENGNWSASLQADETTTAPDVTSRPFSSRMSIVWSKDFEIQHRLVSFAPNSGDNCISHGAIDSFVPEAPESESIRAGAIPANGQYLPMIPVGGSPDPSPQPCQ